MTTSDDTKNRRASAIMLALAALACSCATQSAEPSRSPNSLDQQISCGWAHAPADPILRSELELAQWLDTAKEEAPPIERSYDYCERSQLGAVDWASQSVAIVDSSSASTIERMAVRGDTLVLHTKGIAQCGGQEIPGWRGAVLVVVPAKVVGLESKYKRARPCPPGPPQP